MGPIIIYILSVNIIGSLKLDLQELNEFTQVKSIFKLTNKSNPY